MFVLDKGIIAGVISSPPFPSPPTAAPGLYSGFTPQQRDIKAVGDRGEVKVTKLALSAGWLFSTNDPHAGT